MNINDKMMNECFFIYIATCYKIKYIHHIMRVKMMKHIYILDIKVVCKFEKIYLLNFNKRLEKLI